MKSQLAELHKEMLVRVKLFKNVLTIFFYFNSIYLFQ